MTKAFSLHLGSYFESFTYNLIIHLHFIIQVPENDLSTTPGYIAPQIHSNPEIEQIVVLTLTGHLYMKTFGLFLGKSKSASTILIN